MTPQSSFMVIAPLERSRVDSLRTLMATMNQQPGVANPHNKVVAFGEFEGLHFARFVILEDGAAGDIATACHVPPGDLGVFLAFLADCDGTADDFLDELVRRAGQGLRRLFSHCRGFTPDCDLRRWMKEHERKAAVAYVNWRGRTVRQVREEHDLHIALQSRLDSGADTFAGKRPREVREDLSEFVKAQQQAGRLALSRPARTPLGWRMRDLFHCAGVPIVLLMIGPLLVLYLPILACQLRRHEKQDLEIAPPPDPAHVAQLTQREDHGATNQFSAFGSVKPGLFRRYTLIFILWIINYTTRHIYNHGNLARVGTIHFARWVFLNKRQRLLFASNYDGSLESYMSDFIDKVAWGLNSVFSNGVGYPATNWLIKGGAKDEQKFKYYIRRHQLITDVWYNAYPGLTAFDLRRNALIRAGLERAAMTDAEIREWLALI